MDSELERHIARRESNSAAFEQQVADINARTMAALMAMMAELSAIVSNSPARGWIQPARIVESNPPAGDAARTDDYSRHIFGLSIDAFGLGKISHNPCTGTWGYNFSWDDTKEALRPREHILDHFRSNLASYIVGTIPGLAAKETKQAAERRSEKLKFSLFYGVLAGLLILAAIGFSYL